MTDEEKLMWEKEKQRLGHHIRWGELHSTYATLVREACVYASPAKETKTLNRWPMEKLSDFINKKFTYIKDAEVPSEPYLMAKEQLFRAFKELAEQWSKYPLVDSNEVHCLICHGELTTVYDEPTVCEHCIQPVLEALDNLVRASTSLLTPELLREQAISNIALGFPYPSIPYSRDEVESKGTSQGD